jgi:peptidylprolyl isomerase/FKBP-type peptidyl-prolyl cis-trans isomerase SlyD
MPIKQNDFIEIEFTGKLKDGGVFDSNVKEDLEKLHQGHDHPIETKPFVLCVGQGMFLKGVEDFLIGKEPGDYEIELSSEKAFGNRDSKLIQIIPTKFFHEQKLNPVSGAVFNFDNRVGKVLTSSGGRVIVDFNNPLAGKDVVYKVKVLRIVEDINEKVKSFTEFLFRKDFKFEVKEKKLLIEVEKELSKFVELFKDKFKEIFDLELEVKEIEEIKEKK